MEKRLTSTENPGLTEIRFEAKEDADDGLLWQDRLDRSGFIAISIRTDCDIEAWIKQLAYGRRYSILRSIDWKETSRTSSGVNGDLGR